jgi:hemolysin-activating ACP:hemolysin acyltransferase
MQQIVDLFRHYDKHNLMTDDQLRLYLMPSIRLGQCLRIYDGEELVAFANWAYLHHLVEQRFKNTGKIKPSEWKSGNNLWIIEIVSIGKTKELMKQLINKFKQQLSIGKSVKWLRTDKDIYRIGEKFKREFHS